MSWPAFLSQMQKQASTNRSVLSHWCGQGEPEETQKATVSWKAVRDWLAPTWSCIKKERKKVVIAVRLAISNELSDTQWCPVTQLVDFNFRFSCNGARGSVDKDSCCCWGHFSSVGNLKLHHYDKSFSFNFLSNTSTFQNKLLLFNLRTKEFCFHTLQTSYIHEWTPLK